MSDRPLIQPLDEYTQRLLSHVRPPDWRNPTPARLYDLVVIGGGTAGLVCAAGAAGLGARVALVERTMLGGDCLNTGCVPSKALLRSARAVLEARRGATVGVRATADVDFTAVMARLRERRADIAPHDSAAKLVGLGVDVFFGDAAFASPRSVTVDGRTLAFRRAVIATGGRPVVPDLFVGADLKVGPYQVGPYKAGVYTSENIFSLTEQPASLLIMGAGPIGCEMAQAFALLGTKVTLCDTAPRILPREDPDAAAIVAKRLTDDGVTIAAGSDPLTRIESGGLTPVLFATGRTPNLAGLNLAAAGVEYDESGIRVDDRLRSSNRRVYAAGDVCSRYQFTHAADAMARIVIQNALFFGRRRASALVIPWCTYTVPEVAHVGLSPDEATASGAAHVTVPLADVDRALVDEDTDGFVRIHHQHGRIVAATIVAAHAGELIGYVASVMRRGGSLGDFSSEIFPYPTVADAFRAAGDRYRRTRLTPRIQRILSSYFHLLRR